MSLQITIPAIVLFIIGIGVYFAKRKEYGLDPTIFLIIISWFLLPFASILILKPTIYDNFRHFLFITPPIFLFAGLAIKYIFSKIRIPIISILIVLVIILPGIAGIITLHPYEYIYYNMFIGGVGGAYRKFETDYWYTSYVECTNYLNDQAPLNSTILVIGPIHIVESYFRWLKIHHL